MVGVLKFRFAVPAGGGFPVFSSQALELLMACLGKGICSIPVSIKNFHVQALQSLCSLMLSADEEGDLGVFPLA
ncbi:hypothetical protein NC653_014211 [Populus alba x Populus x berolinensis]|uniref:Uncharacterized protein n=1 Tax=Populus alba x Populus x berolinensis TaxID=444605 RepID=A0AAD6W3H2_9ROSI|nr:hypothetical protein NC653_014211 [Populus alba x Populus x berolinensis]